MGAGFAVTREEKAGSCGSGAVGAGGGGGDREEADNWGWKWVESAGGGGDARSERHSGSPSVVAERGAITLSRPGPLDGGGVEKRFTSHTCAVFCGPHVIPCW